MPPTLAPSEPKLGARRCRRRRGWRNLFLEASGNQHGQLTHEFHSVFCQVTHESSKISWRVTQHIGFYKNCYKLTPQTYLRKILKTSRLQPDFGRTRVGQAIKLALRPAEGRSEGQCDRLPEAKPIKIRSGSAMFQKGSQKCPGTCFLVPGAGFCASGPGSGRISCEKPQTSLLRPVFGRPEGRCLHFPVRSMPEIRPGHATTCPRNQKIVSGTPLGWQVG